MSNKTKSKWRIKAVLENIEDLKELNSNEKKTVYQNPPFDSDKILQLVKDKIEHYFSDKKLDDDDGIISISVCQQISKEIRDSLKIWPSLKRYRIVSVVTLVEKNNQGIMYRSKHVLDPNSDNLVKFYFGFSRFFVVAFVYLIFQD